MLRPAPVSKRWRVPKGLSPLGTGPWLVDCCCWRHGGKVCHQRLVFQVAQGCHRAACCIVDATLPAVSILVTETCVVRTKPLSIDGAGKVRSPIVVEGWLRLLMRAPAVRLRSRWP